MFHIHTVNEKASDQVKDYNVQDRFGNTATHKRGYDGEKSIRIITGKYYLYLGIKRERIDRFSPQLILSFGLRG